MVNTPINESAIPFIVWHLFSRGSTQSYRIANGYPTSQTRDAGSTLVVTARRVIGSDGRLHSGAWFLLRNGCALTAIRC
jgi:hypothetical protein